MKSHENDGIPDTAITGVRLTRRALIGMLGSAGAALAIGCGESSPASPTAISTTTTTGTAAGSCAITPTETEGPFPSLTDMFRSDVREGKPGAQLTLNIKVVNVNGGCSPVANANVEIWHVDAAGNYSQYGSQQAQTFLRGIQTTNANGDVTFVTIYPGWYQGRATHIHVDVTSGSRSVKVTQIAFPESINNTVHRSGAYASRGTNPMSNAADGIFADSLSAELVTPAGSVESGYVATFQVGVSI